MKKILCPVDFSNASRNGLEYAGNLAAELMAHVTLLYVRPTIWPEAVQLNEEKERSTEEINGKLLVMSDQVEKEFGVTCGIHVEPTTMVVEKAIALKGANYDLILTGSNGADDFYQLAFGSHSFQIMQKAMCPVMIIPEGCSYKPIRQIAFAYDPDTNPLFLVDQLRSFAEVLGTSVKVVHVVEDARSDENDHKLQSADDCARWAAPAGPIRCSSNFSRRTPASCTSNRKPVGTANSPPGCTPTTRHWTCGTGTQSTRSRSCSVGTPIRRT